VIGEESWKWVWGLDISFGDCLSRLDISGVAVAME